MMLSLIDNCDVIVLHASWATMRPVEYHRPLWRRLNA